MKNILVALDLKELIEDIRTDIEWLSTSEDDEVECISIENLEGILSRHINLPVKLSEDSEEEPESDSSERKIWSAMQGGTDGG